MRLPDAIWMIVLEYKKEMEALDAFHAFLYEVFDNLMCAMKSK